jgi:hypothetical protein
MHEAVVDDGLHDLHLIVWNFLKINKKNEIRKSIIILPAG